MRKTSREAYDYICENGILGQRMFQAYDCMFQNGPMTAKELTVKAGIDGLWKVCSVLREMDLFLELGERTCSITGRNSILWDVTDKYPKTIKKEKKQSWKKRYQALEKEFVDLKRRYDSLSERCQIKESKKKTDDKDVDTVDMFPIEPKKKVQWPSYPLIPQDVLWVPISKPSGKIYCCFKCNEWMHQKNSFPMVQGRELCLKCLNDILKTPNKCT